MAFSERMSFWTVHAFVLTLFLGKGICDSICPNGIENKTDTMSGEIVYPSSGNYGVNETKCWRIQVPKPYRGIGITYQTFDIEECKNCACDFLAISTFYNGLGFGSCGRHTSNYLERENQQRGPRPQEGKNGENIWIRFKSDDTVHRKGFNFKYIVKSYDSGGKSNLNASAGETIEFSTPKFGIKNYPESFEYRWFLMGPEGSQVTITFDTFELEQSKDCENDYLEIREAYFENTCCGGSDLEGEYGAILSKAVCGTNKPSTIQSAGNMVWVHFKSDSNATTTYKGFKASFTTSGQGRFTINHLMTLLFTSALLVLTSKDSVF